MNRLTRARPRGQNRCMGVRPLLIALCSASLLLAVGQHPSAAMSAGAAAAPASSHLRDYVSDMAHVLPPASKARLAKSLKAFEHRTRHQMVVVTTPSLGGKDIAAYARAWGNRRGIGRKGINDGAIVLVAPNERKVRIAVGDGLTAQLPDERCQAIIDRDMLPSFRAGDFGAGLERGVAALSRQVH